MPSIILSDNGVSSGSAGLKSTAASDGSLALQTTTAGGTATTAVSIDTSQNVTMAGRTTNPTTISVGGATPSSSGSGITFPATQSASTDANTLDDYEEGTWTPIYSTDGTQPTVSYAAQVGRYTKVGRLVTCFVRIARSSSSGGSGSIYIGGLPFAAASTFTYGQPTRTASWNWTPASPDYKVETLYVVPSATTVGLWDLSTNVINVSVLNAATNAATVVAVFSYMTD
jgi:hypothetical protein